MPNTILVIDDDRVFLEKTQQFLEKNGFQVEVASSWVDFMNAYYGGPATPDIILFDINLGGSIPGDKMLLVFKEARKKIATAQKTKLVLFSSLPDAEIQTRAQLCGADGYIEKHLLTTQSGSAFLLKLRSFLK
jgi:DNA-binding response OmpR family regulator